MRHCPGSDGAACKRGQEQLQLPLTLQRRHRLPAAHALGIFLTPSPIPVINKMKEIFPDDTTLPARTPLHHPPPPQA